MMSAVLVGAVHDTLFCLLDMFLINNATRLSHQDACAIWLALLWVLVLVNLQPSERVASMRIVHCSSCEYAASNINTVWLLCFGQLAGTAGTVTRTL